MAQSEYTAFCCIFSDIKRHSDWKPRFFRTPFYITPGKKRLRIFPRCFFQAIQVPSVASCKYLRVYSVNARIGGQTDGQTDGKVISTAERAKSRSQKTLDQDAFWQKMKSRLAKDTDQKIAARSLTLLILSSVWSTTTLEPGRESLSPM